VSAPAVPRELTRRLLPLQIGVGLQGLMLWTPIEKLFQTEIGFDAASIGLMAAAYSAVVPLLEVPSGILADRWRRTGLLIIGGVAAAASALVGGLSHGVVTYIVAAMILGLYFAASSGTVDSVVYDTVVEETGSADLYEKVVGRVRMVESAAFAGSALVGGLLAGWTSPRLTYLVTVPFALLSVVALARFREPQLHRQGEPVALRRHIATTFGALRITQVRHMLLLAALAAVSSQAVFEFGPLWLVELAAPPAAYGPYWALLVATLGVGGYLAGRLHLDRTLPVLVLAGLIVVMPVVLATARILPVVAAAQTVLALVLATVGIHAGRLLHDAVPSAIRAGVSAGAGTFSWMLFLPFSLVFGALARDRGLAWAAWVLAGVAAVLAILLAVSVRTARAVPVEVDETARPGPTGPAPADLACRELVGIVSDYVDGVLPADWRVRADEHLQGCDGCTAYLQQIRDTVDLLARLDLPARPDGR
jgi:MFS family permease